MYDFDGASKKFKEAYERAVRDIEDHNYANLSMVWNDDFWNKLFSGQNCAEKKRYDLVGI